MSGPPLATYRLQLHPGFDFDAAAAVVGYLADLGVSHVHVSPVLQAAPGSTHGYDVVDHSRVSDDLGGAAGHARLVAALAAAGLGQVLDIVPNHMAIGTPANRWWWDVLEHGPSSPWAGHFDVTWDPPEEKLRNTVLLPVLGDHYGRVLDRGEVGVERRGATFTVRYFDQVLPVSPRSLAGLLDTAAAAAGDDDLAFVAAAYRRLPPAARTDAASVAERHRDTGVLRRQLARLVDERPATAAAVDAALGALVADVDALDAFLEAQNYRIAYWRTAERELGYRRFFDIDTLVGLRVEDPEVFADTHELVLRWVRDGVVDGLRVDHPDGLRDPEQYADRLARATGGVWTVVEKILEPGEELPEGWPVAGTTGYDRMAIIGGLFLDPASEAPLTTAYGELTGAGTDPAVVVADAKGQAVRQLLAADVGRLTALLVEVCEGRRQQRDRTRHELHEAVQELVAAFPVYRTYVRAEAGVVRREDEARVAAAVAAAGARRPDVDPDLLAFLADLLLLRLPDRRPAEDEWVMRFQQLTGPAMAKGVEDTAFYRFTRLGAQNEVGGSLDRFGVRVDEFHAANARAHDRWPATMTALSTHDTKRSADVRARLALLSEIPGAWAEACGRWMTASARHWPGGDPDRHAQHLLFQTLVGAWPLPGDRAVAYLAKATREAKLRTSWTQPDPAYDEARDAFVAAVAADEELAADIAGFVAPLVAPGRAVALAQALVQLTVPGVPDTYQGTELWDLSLVDPDNRRPVDFARRRALVAEVAAGLAPEDLLARADDGLPKLAVVRAALHLRRRRPAVFGAGAAGAYLPLAVTGPAAAHAVAYARGEAPDGAVAVVVPRLVLGLAARPGGWDGTTVDLPPGPWTDVVTGARVAAGGGPVAVADLLARFPVALLERTGGASNRRASAAVRAGSARRFGWGGG
jgi:(1->4)-alpha-D-glucan 1-alpha-D-glucosylmutase